MYQGLFLVVHTYLFNAVRPYKIGASVMIKSTDTRTRQPSFESLLCHLSDLGEACVSVSPSAKRR